jgi:hypothetical protein
MLGNKELEKRHKSINMVIYYTKTKGLQKENSNNNFTNTLFNTKKSTI